MKLRLKHAKVLSLSIYPGEEGPSQVLLFSALLTPGAADRLQCREVCYQQVGELIDGKPSLMPRKLDSVALSVSIDGADVILGELSVRAKKVCKFKVAKPKSAEDSDISLEVRARMHFDGHLHLSDWIQEVNRQEFEIRINARQEDLDFGEPTEDEDEPGDADDACIDCANGIDLEADGVTHASGQPCANAAEKENASLARAVAVAGGTHQSKRRRMRVPMEPVGEDAKEPVN